MQSPQAQLYTLSSQQRMLCIQPSNANTIYKKQKRQGQNLVFYSFLSLINKRTFISVQRKVFENSMSFHYRIAKGTIKKHIQPPEFTKMVAQ